MALPKLSLSTALLALSLLAQPAQAQQQGYGQTFGSGQQERELNYGSGPSRGGGILDSANPIDLMNRIRRGTAMDDATTPGDAVDAALRDFHAQQNPTPLTQGSVPLKPAP